ncbi:non-homologous end-joining factor 1-like [Teleopsis dalmanni]|uniref:non-homologous end-joining factor 1-like n=1 Tax=Teleopsis dalmanni TaxID=139649 RepID=UPI0018CDC960|nr:non-homologous end-joining factor 1-like [Teleopsis dalmanni]
MWIKHKIIHVGASMANIKTENGQFIMFCVVNGDTMEYKATNMDETYAEKLKISEVMNRVKELNKRIRFDEKTVCDTLTQRQPDDEIWLDEHDDSKGLKLKYMIRKCPFNFNFYLKKQAEEEHKYSLMVPLFKTIASLSEQIVELRDAVTRKDVEIQQFKKEGAILKRSKFL